MGQTAPRRELIIPSTGSSTFTATFLDVHRIGLSYDDPKYTADAESNISTSIALRIIDKEGNTVYEKSIAETTVSLFEYNIDEQFDNMPMFLNVGEEYHIEYSGSHIDDGLLGVALYGRQSSLLWLFVFASIVTLIVFSLCIFGISRTEGLLNLKLFFVAFGIMSFAMNIILVPYSVQDELAHFGISYSLSSKMMGLEAVNENKRVYLYQDGLCNIAWCNNAQNEYHFWNFDYGNTEGKYLNSTLRLSDSLQKQAYIFPAIGITIARIFKAPYQIVLFAGRFMNLLMFIFVCYFSLRLMTRFRDSIKAVILFPSIIWLTCSYSYDTWNLAFCIALFAYIIYLKYRPKKVGWLDILALSVIMFLLVPIKFIYFLMGLGIFLLARDNFKNRIWQFGTYVWTLFWGVFVAFKYRGMSATSFVSNRTDDRAGVVVAVNEAAENAVSEVVNRQSFSLGWIFASKHNILHTIEVYINTIFDQIENYLYKIVEGHYIELNISELAVFIVLFVCVIIILDECREYEISLRDKLVATFCILAGVGAVLTTFLFVYSFVHVTVIGTIDGVQGRYFIPFLLYLPFLLNKGHIKYTKDRTKYLMCYEILLSMFIILLSLSELLRN